MQRIPEPELMDEEQQARAYAAADFSEPHGRFIDLFSDAFPDFSNPAADVGANNETAADATSCFVLDLGCGPGDIAVRFARAYPDCIVHGIDGAAAMLQCGRRRLEEERGLSGRIEFFQQLLPATRLPRTNYAAVISNSLLHHLADPSTIWDTIKLAAAPGAAIFIMDLLRPQTEAEARRLVEVYMPDDPEILRRDFHKSLLAAFTLAEIESQLKAAGLNSLIFKQVSDRHLAAWGTIGQ